MLHTSSKNSLAYLRRLYLLGWWKRTAGLVADAHHTMEREGKVWNVTLKICGYACRKYRRSMVECQRYWMNGRAMRIKKLPYIANLVADVVLSDPRWKFVSLLRRRRQWPVQFHVGRVKRLGEEDLSANRRLSMVIIAVAIADACNGQTCRAVWNHFLYLCFCWISNDSGVQETNP